MGIKARAQQNLTKVFDGSGVFSIILTNENTSIPISNQGLALNYTATPSDIYVYSGTSLIKPVASNPEPGEYTITASGENITAGVISYNGNHASIGNASDFVTDKQTYSITFTASGKDFLGNPFTSQKKQVITALRHGDDATSYWVNTTASVVMKDVNDVLQPSSVSASAVSQEGFANATPYKGIFKVYIKTGVAFPTTPAYTSPAPEVSHTVNLDTTMNDIRIDMYSADGSNLLDTQTVPVIAQANGVISTSIQYTVTDKNVQPTESASWADTIPTVGIGQFLWTKTTFYYTDGSNAVAYSMGHVGKDGASAPLLFLSSDSQAFTFDGAGNPNPVNQTINFVANLQNLTGTATFVATPYLDGAAGTPIALGGTGNARSLTVAQFGQVYDSVSVKASLGNLSDTETVYKLKDGANGQNGAQGVPGPKGPDGLTTYVHIAYANSSNGSSNFSTTDSSNRSYIGVYTDTAVPDSTDYTKYTWSLIKGADGADGTPGPKGADGRTSYIHLAYANSADGNTNFSTTDPTGRAYIGVYTDFTVADSNTPSMYTWSLVKGQDGSDGIQGPKGADGISTYVHFAYANSSDGKTDFSTTDYANKKFIGILTDTSVPDSTDYTKYTWSLIKGADGANGAQGVPGPKGADGISTYIHFAYANSANGSSNFSTTDSSNRAYIGVYTDTAVPDSTDYTKYTWSLIKGADGTPGPKGADGRTSYIHLAYANSADGNTNFSTTDPTGRAYIGVYTDFTVADSNTPSVYTWSLVKGQDGRNGSDGIQGPKGADGISTYVHFAYANSADGKTDFSTTDYANKKFIGTLTDTSVPDSTDPTRYTWSLIKGADGANGAQGVPGPKGADGISTYIHFAYADSSNGSSNFSTTDSSNRAYIGVYTDTAVPDSTDYTKYTWSLIKGADGADGTPGPKGADGRTSYIHLAYANSADGNTSFSTTDPTGRAYIGVYTDFTVADSNTPSMYTWSLIKGADGADGTPGPKGADGRTSYIHVAYANSADGTSGFSVTDPTGRAYIGVYTDFTMADSNTPSVYTWSLVKGQDGSDGIQGPKGADGISTYVHFAYANSADGKTDFSTTVYSGKTYLGTLTDFTVADSTDYTKYTWSLIKGADGADGTPGPKGADGRTSYIHLAYANSADGNTSFSTTDPTGRAYIGVYTDFTVADSNTPSVYTWSLVKGQDGRNGSDGAPGPKGADGRTSYIHVAYANSSDGTSGFSTSDAVGKKYIGVYTDFTVADSSTPSVYTWSLIKGADGANGAQGVPGPKGADGLTTYVHFVYAGNATGTLNFSTTDPSGRPYMGVMTDTTPADSTDPTRYTWSLIKGADGSVGPTGATGAPGPKGSDGLTTYVHIAYANSANGATSFSTTDPTGKAYIGALTDTSVPDSTDYTKYTWSLVKGADGANGAQGVPGPKGADGISTYIHFAYANSADGKTDFSTTVYSGKTYLGTLTDTVVADSTDYTKYTWSLIKGPQGQTGPQGIQGPVGPNGVSTYVHFAYANSADGTVGFSTTANNQTYIGVYTDSTQTGAITPSRYTWSLMKGADGKNAITGWLTNESITLQADSNGNVPSYTSATGSFVVYNGTNQVTGLTVNQANAVGMTLNISGMNYNVTGMVADIAYVDLSVTYSGTTITKRLTLAKSKSGANGANGTSVVNSTTPPSNPTAGQWWNDMSVTPNVLKVYQSGNWIPYRIDAINLVAQSVTTDKLASDVLVASNVTYTNKNGTSTNLQTFNFDGIQTLLTDGNGHTYSSMDNAVSSTQSWTSLSKQVNDLGQVNQLFNTEFSPDFAGWNIGTPNISGKFTTTTPLSSDTSWSLSSEKFGGSNVLLNTYGSGSSSINSGLIPIGGNVTSIVAIEAYSSSNYNGTVTSSLRFYYYDSNQNYISSTLKDSSKITSWTRVIASATSPSNAAYVVVAFVTNGSVGTSSYSQPMMVFSGSIGAYVPGQYNNNDRVLKIEKSADDFKISIGQSVKDAKSSADSANTKVDNLSVGGRNLFLGTKYFSGNGNWNINGNLVENVYQGLDAVQTAGAWGGPKYNNSALESQGIIQSVNDTFIMSAWVRNTGTTPISIYFYGDFVPTSNKNMAVLSANSGWVRINTGPFQFSKTSGLTGSLRFEPTTGATGGNIQQVGLKLEKGTIATDWTPAPEDQSAEITTQLNLAANSFTLGIDSNGNLISGISGNSKTLSLNGATIYLNSKTVIADNFVTTLLTAQDATIGNTLTIGSGGSIQSTLDGSVWDFTANPYYYTNNGTTKAPWWQVQQQGTMAIDTSSTLHFDGSLTANDVSIGSTPQYAYYTQTGTDTLGGTNKLNVSTSLGLNGLRIDQQDATNAAATGGYVFVTGHGLFTGYDQANPRFSVQSNGNVMADKLTFIGGIDYQQVVGSATPISNIYQLNFNGGRNLYLDGGQYVRIASTGGINSSSKLYVTDSDIQLLGGGSGTSDATMILRVGKNNNNYLYYESKMIGSAGSALYMASDGAILVHSSATKYKSNIEYDTTTSLADRLMTVDLASWNDKNEERMRQEYKTVGNTPDYAIDKDGARYVGLIAEDLVKADLEEFVVRDVDTGSVESIRYDRIGIALIPAVRQQRDMINELRLEIERLKDKVQ